MGGRVVGWWVAGWLVAWEVEDIAISAFNYVVVEVEAELGKDRVPIENQTFYFLPTPPLPPSHFLN